MERTVLSDAVQEKNIETYVPSVTSESQDKAEIMMEDLFLNSEKSNYFKNDYELGSKQEN